MTHPARHRLAHAAERAAYAVTLAAQPHPGPAYPIADAMRTAARHLESAAAAVVDGALDEALGEAGAALGETAAAWCDGDWPDAMAHTETALGAIARAGRLIRRDGIAASAARCLYEALGTLWHLAAEHTMGDAPCPVAGRLRGAHRSPAR